MNSLPPQTGFSVSLMLLEECLVVATPRSCNFKAKSYVTLDSSRSTIIAFSKPFRTEGLVERMSIQSSSKIMKMRRKMKLYNLNQN